jgi:hypothetical protein
MEKTQSRFIPVARFRQVQFRIRIRIRIRFYFGLYVLAPVDHLEGLGLAEKDLLLLLR